MNTQYQIANNILIDLIGRDPCYHANNTVIIQVYVMSTL